MSDVAIRVEGLGKRYRIGVRQEKYQTFRDSVSSALTMPVRAVRSLSQRNGHTKKSDYIWALKDVSFEIKRGDVVGVVGRNGAGKSTLLKILSRITDPTEGLADIYGRVGSLLEVGTGFHPELTGRENMYLNGAILGMGRKEIDEKFDEIVAFAEIEKFIDTPVKHYSSGMYVRLAFAVAAHLETEILLVDEVLAVGDAAFQRKCLGKMTQVAEIGRTVFFVSHNMGVIQSLCPKALFFEKGLLADFGKSVNIINKYLNESSLSQPSLEQIRGKDRRIDITHLEVEQNGIENSACLSSTESVNVTIHYKIKSPLENLLLGFDVLSAEGTQLFRTYDLGAHGMGVRLPGDYTSVLVFPANLFQHRTYFLDLVVGIHREGWITRNEVRLKLPFNGARSSDVDFPGVLNPFGQWQLNRQVQTDADCCKQVESNVRNLR